MVEAFEAMAEHNPFFFRDEKNRFCYFRDNSQVYLELLERLYKQAPKGYIDLVLFLVDNCNMERSDAESFLVNFYRSAALNKHTTLGMEGVCLVDWSNIDTSRKELEGIAAGLHWITETSFNKSMFNSGFNQFKLKMNLFV